jgi:hypothetical protein
MNNELCVRFVGLLAQGFLQQCGLHLQMFNTRETKYTHVSTLVPWAGFEHVIPLSTHKAPWSTQRLWSEFGIIKEEVCSYSCLRFLWSSSVRIVQCLCATRMTNTGNILLWPSHFPCCGLQCKVVTVPKVIDGFILWQGKRFAFVTEYRYDDPVTPWRLMYEDSSLLGCCVFLGRKYES